MKKKLILLGGGGHCVSCIDVIESESKYKIHGILDTAQNVGKTVLGYPILGTDNDILKYVRKDYFFLITIGHIKSNKARRKLFIEITKCGGKFATVVSSRAYIANSASIGQGTIVMHDALINANARIKENCIINSKALIEHDSFVDSDCHISTGAIVNGGACIGHSSFIGSGAVVVNSVSVPASHFVKANSIFVRK
ncbi:NeuD/PglB/VioB family sugar acetyltransferase [Motilimonas eburnea]|uniref:NeuD/PglB/VioB family sugar acetyltransferase n=1 Tax=Motilimonas eburnea TaxID=1737488 RepID=UPI001E34643C|nr:NeuD/PglB/VioB family sugar acetyltransferase [Motilimonas eburnea]MCE2572596.1 NeuD/PglB/VioB family sugar acetyltransferase [Motilimonas eburnea]